MQYYTPKATINMAIKKFTLGGTASQLPAL
jgi:hypothetical protein